MADHLAQSANGEPGAAMMSIKMTGKVLLYSLTQPPPPLDVERPPTANRQQAAIPLLPHT